MKFSGRLLAVVLACFSLHSFCAGQARSPVSASPARFDFGLIGDTPYNDFDATNSCPNLFEDLNHHRLAFVVHDGDIKSGSVDCSDELFLNRYRIFQTCKHPFILVFGDNEWSDCAKAAGKPADPLERLAKLREIFTQGDHSLGLRTIPLRRQSLDPEFASYRENVRWTYGGIVFITLNVPGADNHYRAPEFAERNKANLTWLRYAFDLAAQSEYRALMIIMQANPHFELPSTNQAQLGFNAMLDAFETGTLTLGKPVVLVHGDTHYFRIDKPLVGQKSKRRLENFTRVETFGNPDVHWIRATADRRDPNVFTFRQQIVTRNHVRHR